MSIWTWSRLPHELVFLHFYSGHRRSGDVQHQLEQMALPEGCTLTVASVDVAVNAQVCDLMQMPVQKRWLSFIKDGFASGLGNGPPCETWSVARHQRIQGMKGGGPRPLRDNLHPWGKADLRVKEAQQVHTGNTLMGFSVQATILQGLSGGFAYMEHPGDPSEMAGTPETAASIWHTDVIRKCLELPTFHLRHVFQGHYGGLSAKPTGLLLTGIDECTSRALAERCRTTKIPQRSSIGMEDGHWKTAALKTYPTDFCTYLAKMYSEWVHGLSDRPRCSFAKDVQWLQELCVQIEAQPGASTALPDYHQESNACNSLNLFS